MADDLMDFTEFDTGENDENIAPGEDVAPKLMQTPIVKNSILKQSTKDNLIQLFTPVQKNKRLKVHFTPNVIQSAENIPEEKTSSGEGTATTLSNGADESVRDDDEEREDWAERTSVLTKKDHEDYTQYAREFLLDIVTNLPIKEEEHSTDSGIDESMMDVQEEGADSTSQTNTASNDTDKYDDILSQAADLLKSLRQHTGSSSSDIEGEGRATESAAPVVYGDHTEEAMDCDEPMEVDLSVLQTEVNQFATEAEPRSPASNINNNNEGETPHNATSLSEMQQPRNESGNEPQSNTTLVNDQEQEAEKLSVFCEDSCVTDLRKDATVDTVNHIESVDTRNNDSELKQHYIEVNVMEMSKDYSENENIHSNDTMVKSDCEPSEIEGEKPKAESGLISLEKEAKRGMSPDDVNSSDEEFLSADEDMKIEQAKEPESPCRTPPKKGYDLNFDDLEAMNPFQTKTCVQNSPDSNDKPIAKLQNKDCSKLNGNIEKSVNKGMKTKVTDKVVEETLHSVEKPTELKNAANKETSEKLESPTKHLDIDVKVVKSSKSDESDKKDGSENETEGAALESKTETADEIQKELNMDRDVEASPPLPKRGTYNLDDLDIIDPFQTRRQIVNSPAGNQEKTAQNIPETVDVFQQEKPVPNSPLALETEKDSVNHQGKETGEVKMSDTKEQKVPSLDSAKKKKKKKKSHPQEKENPINLPENLDDIDPFESGNKIMNSPIIQQSTYMPLPDNLDDIDPFKSKKQMMNSPVNAALGSKVIDVAVPENKDTSFSEPKKENLLENLDDIDPFKTTKQLVNSPDKISAVNSIEEKIDDIDPFKPKKQILNSPNNSAKHNDLPNTLEEIDPFKSNTKMLNSPVPSKDEQCCGLEMLDDIDPFKPQKQIVNSPDKKVNDLPDTLQDVDPFKPNKQLGNSPVSNNYLAGYDLDNLDMVDPFKPKIQITNSPDLKVKLNNKQLEDLEESTEANKNHEDKTEVTENIASEKFKDAFDDIDPFKPKSKIQNSPKSTSEKDLANNDPFKPDNQIANSPVGKKQDEEAVAKDEFSPQTNSDPFINKRRLPSTPEDKFGSEDEVIEVQGVTRRGAAGRTNPQGFDVDDSEFVAASEVFKDPGVWEMLEQFGSNATNPVQESALSRMSLYVKFDPLVDTTNLVTNPRRISIKPKQLEKVKEYGLDETLLLLGTPPKKRRQSMNVSQLRHTPVTRGTPADDTQRKKDLNLGQGAVDLIMALSPDDSNTTVSKKSSHPSSLLSTLDDENDAAGLFEELKYTDSDLKRLRTDLKLEFQGQLIVREKEWYKEKEQYEKRHKESRAALDAEKKGSQEMAKACFLFEETIQKLSGIQENDKKQIADLNKEKKQLFEDIQGVENAFADLHRRYEKLKGVVEDQRKNEETLKKYVKDIMDKLKTSEEKYISHKKTSEEKDAKSSQEVARLKGEIAGDQSKHEAAKKIMTMKIENLERQLEQKKDENKKLTEICDQLIQNSEKQMREQR